MLNWLKSLKSPPSQEHTAPALQKEDAIVSAAHAGVATTPANDSSLTVAHAEALLESPAAEAADTAIATEDIPEEALALMKEGNAALSADDYDGAVTAFRHAIRIKSDYAHAYHNLGLAQKFQGKIDDAQRAFRFSLSLNPELDRAYYHLGTIAGMQGRNQEAVDYLIEALKRDAGFTACYNDLALSYFKLGDTKKAEETIAQGLASNPGDPEIYLAAGSFYTAAENPEKAIECFRKAIFFSPSKNSPEALFAESNLIPLLDSVGRADEAEKILRDRLAILPDHVVSLRNLGLILFGEKKYAECMQYHERALELMPNNVSTLNNYGLALQRMDRYDEAVALYHRAISLEPNNPISHLNLGTAYNALMNLPFARLCYEKAIQLGKTPNSEFNLAMLQLLAGDFTSGWSGYESRWLTPDMKKSQRNFKQPIWLGQEKISGKKILLHAEQGLGDTLQFVRYIERVATLGATIYLEVQPELKAIIQSMPLAPFVARILSKGEPLPPFDLHCPLLSLPLAFRTIETTIPMPRPYIVAPPSRMPVWQERIVSDKKKIGLVWSGNENHSNDRNRSMPISALLPFLDNDRCQFYLLQPKIRERDILHIPMQCIDLGPMLTDFSDTAAAIARLDLVITVDTSVAHLAGAMGKPVWIMLPRVPDFRWLLEKKTSPWYPSATLFRQPDLGDWASVIDDVTSQLKIFSSDK